METATNTNKNDSKETTQETLNVRPVYSIEEKELKKIEIDKNIFLRVLYVNGRSMIDVRRYYKGYPTKKGIRFSLETYRNIKDLID